MGVFANGLEISGKSVGAKTIAAMPDVCMTPPESPATPPGVPVPYPSFGMAGDTDKGTGKVMIGGKEVNLKNKSFLSKTTGTEAGCAAKKGVVSSKNTGKAYFISWSNDVKFEGEPVIRNTDMSTQNHGSDPPNAPPWLHVAGFSGADPGCAKHNIQPYNKLECDTGYDKEHTVEVQFFTAVGSREETLECCKDYSDKDAPCICMKGQWQKEDKDAVAGKAMEKPSGGTRTYTKAEIKKGTKRTGTPHYYKSAAARKWLKDNPKGTLGDFKKECIDKTCKVLDDEDRSEDSLLRCLEKANNEYLKKKMGKTQKQVDTLKRCKGDCAVCKAAK